jgi:hypothetical protein
MLEVDQLGDWLAGAPLRTVPTGCVRLNVRRFFSQRCQGQQRSTRVHLKSRATSLMPEVKQGKKALRGMQHLVPVESCLQGAL